MKMENLCGPIYEIDPGVDISDLLQGGRVNPLPDLGAKGNGGVFEGGIEGCLRALGGGGLDGLDHGWFLRLRSFSHRYFDCAPETLNYLQAGHEIDGGQRSGDRGQGKAGWLGFVVTHPFRKVREKDGAPVSYTHLTLPTIYSV